ncbi:hypothetical protein [Aeromicrobium wangtongii]|uniref:hypothetical protein n=1 Tax=Aeromicrobium wangtongii TaxID=2969247 RepID=UPI002016D415|nr:hypothetical protein [Aeromicrobium wangtongii]MCL3819638.1 hypothetical protein [Aeromicrobium wangtongii]
MADDLSIDTVARRLYGLPVAEFTQARDAAAKQLKASGDSTAAGRVKKFRKPAAGAHLVNLLVRDDPALVDQIDDLGDRLRAAQSQADAGQLRALDQERRALVGRAVTAAGSLGAGGRATAASLRDVEQTAWAAVVDPGACAALRAGLLVRALSPGGFGSVDITDASALPVDEVSVQRSRRAARTAPQPSRRGRADPKNPTATAADRKAEAARREAADRKAEAQRRAREEAREDARRDLASAQQELERAEQAEAEAGQAVVEAKDRVTGLQDELADLRDRISAVEQELREEKSGLPGRSTAVRAAQKARRAADAAVERARERLAELSGDG